MRRSVAPSKACIYVTLLALRFAKFRFEIAYVAILALRPGNFHFEVVYVTQLALHFGNFHFEVAYVTLLALRFGNLYFEVVYVALLARRFGNFYFGVGWPPFRMYSLLEARILGGSAPPPAARTFLSSPKKAPIALIKSGGAPFSA